MSDPDRIQVLDILLDTTADGPGFRTAIYCAGCDHQCPGCHNPESWSFQGGKAYTVHDLTKVILSRQFADVTFTGGDPFYQASAFAKLARQIKSQSNKSIWCYTGFLFEELVKRRGAFDLLGSIDILVDGPFQIKLLDLDLPFRGSRNQRIIDVPKSLSTRKVQELTDL